MESKKSYTPLKVLLSYFALLALIGVVGWFLYTENAVYNNLEHKIALEKNKILRVSNVFSHVYKTESLARQTIQSNSDDDYKKYRAEMRSLQLQIDTLKKGVTTQYQRSLLDSVTHLLSEKTANIKQLKSIKNKASDEVSVNVAIDEITKMEFKLRKLELQDFTKKPEDLGSYQRSVLQKYVDYLNQNIPDDSTNTLSKHASDSILANSKKLLSTVKRETEKKKQTLNFEENKLLKNEIAISDQLQKVLRIIEREIIINSIKNNSLKEKSLKRVNDIVTASAIIGLLLTLVFSVLIVSDYSKSQLYKKQLEKASFKTKNLLRSREQLISTVSHDLKTPLSTIVGYTELLSNSEITTKQKYFITNIKNASEYITQLVQDLLDFSKMEAGKINYEKVPFIVPEIITSVATNIQSVYKEKNIDLQFDFDPKLEQKIVGDPFRVKQILSNIIGNAYKFTEEGFIKISAFIRDDFFYTITIQDTGIGIDKGNHKLVFEEFTQANETIEKNYGGTGLGLSICAKLISAFGGNLNLDSTIGEGSTFEINLPLTLAETDNIDKTIPSHTTDQVFNKKQKVFIVVDDDINLLNLTTTVLKQEGHVVHSFDRAESALEACKTILFDIILTDIQMPNMDGFEFLKTLKTAGNTKYDDQPVIAITGRSDLEQEVYQQAGFATVIQKPYAPSSLLKTVHQVIEEPLNAIQSDAIKHTESHELVSLQNFLGNDEQALREVLQSFYDSSQISLQQMEEYIRQLNFGELNAISHRILPMFKQINATEIVAILSKFEILTQDDGSLQEQYSDLKNLVSTTFSKLLA